MNFLKRRLEQGPVLHRAEWLLATLLSAVAAGLHLLFLRHAGGLWRDEVVSFNIANQPSLLQTWGAVWHDSFPGLFHSVLRAWIGLGLGAADADIRLLGFLVGLCLLGALWWNGRALGYRVPLLSLALFGLSGLAVRWVDAIRAYGVGILFMTLTVGAVWRVVAAPSARNVLLAALAAILAVQALYQNAFLLLAVCLGGLAVAARRGLRRQAAAVAGIGLAAALSLTVYQETLLKMGELRPLLAPGVTFARLSRVFVTALSDGGRFMPWVWLALAAAMLAVSIRAQFASVVPDDRGGFRDLSLFAAVAAAAALAGFLAWLKTMGMPAQPWYFLPLLAPLAVLFDAVLAAAPGAKAVRLSVAAAAALLVTGGAVRSVQARQTNIDVLAAQLEKLSVEGDLILVDPWYCGATFSRYYKGAAAWTTLPPLEDQTLQRLELVKEYIAAEKPIEPVLRKIGETLRARNRVWLVGDLPVLRPVQPPPSLPPAPGGAWGWNHGVYSQVWAAQAAYLIQKKSLRARPLNVFAGGPVNGDENLPLIEVEGWKKP